MKFLAFGPSEMEQKVCLRSDQRIQRTNTSAVHGHNVQKKQKRTTKTENTKNGMTTKQQRPMRHWSQRQPKKKLAFFLLFIALHVLSNARWGC